MVHLVPPAISIAGAILKIKIMKQYEKAKELINTFDNIIPYSPADYLLEDPKHYSKQCALIVVDELIKEHDWNHPISWNVERKKYWESVKQEIESL